MLIFHCAAEIEKNPGYRSKRNPYCESAGHSRHHNGPRQKGRGDAGGGNPDPLVNGPGPRQPPHLLQVGKQSVGSPQEPQERKSRRGGHQQEDEEPLLHHGRRGGVLRQQQPPQEEEGGPQGEDGGRKQRASPLASG